MAAFTATVQIRGLAELDRVLAKLPDQVEEAIMEDALRQSGAVVVRAAQANINSRTGATAADIRSDVQVEPGRHQGAVGIGGTFQGRSGRAYVLRWLELGTAAHKIVAGEKFRRDVRRVARQLRRAGAVEGARILREAARTRERRKRALNLGGGVFRASAKHPGMAAQGPLIRALTEHGDAALKVFRETLWAGIVRFTAKQPKAA